jgi:hypothetical protein
LPDIEFAKAADKNVVTSCEGALDQFQDGFKETRRFGFGNAKARLERAYDVVFGESHGDGNSIALEVIRRRTYAF